MIYVILKGQILNGSKVRSFIPAEMGLEPTLANARLFFSREEAMEEMKEQEEEDEKFDVVYNRNTSASTKYSVITMEEALRRRKS